MSRTHPLSLESWSCLSHPAVKGGGRKESVAVEEAECLSSREGAWPDSLGGVTIQSEGSVLGEGRGPAAAAGRGSGEGREEARASELRLPLCLELGKRLV